MIDFNLFGAGIAFIVALWHSAWIWFMFIWFAFTLYTAYKISKSFEDTNDYWECWKLNRFKIISVTVIWIFLAYAVSITSTFGPKITAQNTKPTTTNELTKSLSKKQPEVKVNSERKNLTDKIKEEPDPFETFKKQREELK